MSKGNRLMHLSDSISCFMACTRASLLVKDGYAVQITASDAALKFIGSATPEGLTNRPVLTNRFCGVSDCMPHISLARKSADLILAYHASANLLNRLAAGLCDDLFGSRCPAKWGVDILKAVSPAEQLI